MTPARNLQLFSTLSYLAGLAFFGLGTVAAAEPDADEASFRALYKELVEINTTLSSGSCTAAAEVVAARLQDAGLPPENLQILAPPERPQDGALIATLPGSDAKAKPILLLAHVDVVEAPAEDWQRDPFTLVEDDGFFYARGASDDKARAAVFADSLIRYRTEGFKPRRSIRLALTCGTETPGTFNGVRWLLQDHPEVLQAAFALNEGVGGELDARGRPIVLQIQAGEKAHQDFTLEVTDPDGHSAQPVRENAIYQLAAGLSRLAEFQFPVHFNAVTQAYFEAEAGLVPTAAAETMRAVLANPDNPTEIELLRARSSAWNSMLRTTCVATRVEAGHALNALPRRARANLSCSILPGTSAEEVQVTLQKVLADDGISITPFGEDAVTGPTPALSKAIMKPLRKLAATIWPTAVIVPTLSIDATDGRFLNAAGIPTYGLSGIFHNAEGSHAHGHDERIRVQSLLDGRRFLYELVKIYAMQPG